MIKLNHVTCTFVGQKTPAVYNLDFEVRPGECVVLTGASGCGKSTLLKIMSGIIPSLEEATLSGTVEVNRKNIFKLQSWQIAQTIGYVNQNPRSQFFTNDTTSELMFSMENMGYSKERMNRVKNEVCEKLKIQYLLDRPIDHLSSGERQKIAIASALTLGPKVLLFDEPSANLDYKATLELASLIQELKKQGYTIIIAEHRIFYLTEVCDRYIYMKTGVIEDVVKANETEKLNKTDLRSIDPFMPKEDAVSNCAPKGNLVCEISHLSYRNLLEDVELKIFGGEIVALIGSNGVGKTTFAKLITGLIKPCQGTVHTKDVTMILQDVDYQLFTESVVSELSLGHKDDLVPTMIEQLGLTGFEHVHPIRMSGGQKQRVLIGCAKLSNARFLILDEPTSGLDAKNMRRVANILSSMPEDVAILVITHDFELIDRMCTRALYLNQGQIETDVPLSNQENREKLISIFKNLKG